MIWHLNQYWYTMLPSFEFLQRKNLIWHLGLFFSQAIMNVIAQLMKVIEKTKMNEKTPINSILLVENISKGSLISIPSPSVKIHCWVLYTNFENKKFVDITQQCFASFAFRPRANFPAHNLNFHWWWRDLI